MARIIQFAGLGVAAISLLLPAIRVPFVGDANLLQSWQGWLILSLLAAAVVTTVLNQALWTKIASGLALAVTVVFLILVVMDFNRLQSQMGSIADSQLSFSLLWSWYPLMMALILVQLAPVISGSLKTK